MATRGQGLGAWSSLDGSIEEAAARAFTYDPQSPSGVPGLQAFHCLSQLLAFHWLEARQALVHYSRNRCYDYPSEARTSWTLSVRIVASAGTLFLLVIHLDLQHWLMVFTWSYCQHRWRWAWNAGVDKSYMCLYSLYFCTKRFSWNASEKRRLFLSDVICSLKLIMVPTQTQR